MVRVNQLLDELAELECSIAFQCVDHQSVIVVMQSNEPVAHVIPNRVDAFYTNYQQFNRLNQEQQQRIQDLLQVFAGTPIAARE